MRSILRQFIFAIVCCAAATAADIVTIRGSIVVGRAFGQAEESLKEKHGLRMNFVPSLVNGEMIHLLGNDVIDMAITTRKFTAAEKAAFPNKTFRETEIGKQVVLVVVPDQVWKSGVRALTKEQFRKIYEGEAKNWKEFGGESRDIKYFNREAGGGIWDLFMIFVYGDVRKAPLSKAETLTSPDEVRNTVEFDGSSVSLLEYAEMKSERLHALGVKLDDGSVVEPTPENIANGKYELTRPLLMVTAKQPTGKLRELVDYMTSKEGQEAVKKAGHVTNAELKAKK